VAVSRILRNVCYAEYDRRSHARAIEVLRKARRLPPLAQAHETPEAQFLRRWAGDTIRRLIAAAPNRSGKPSSLREINLSYREIA